MGWALFPPCSLTWGQTMVEVMKIMATSFKRSHACTDAWLPPTLQQATTDPHLLETPRHSGASLGQSLVGSLLLFLGPGGHNISFVPSKSLFPQSCVSSIGSMVELMATSSKRAYAIPRSAVPRAPALGTEAGHCWPVLPQETLKHSSGSVSLGSLGPGVHKVCLSPPSVSSGFGVWFQTWFCPSYSLARASPWIQHSPVNACSASSCNFGVFPGEDERTSFYSAILYLLIANGN